MTESRHGSHQGQGRRGGDGSSFRTSIGGGPLCSVPLIDQSVSDSSSHGIPHCTGSYPGLFKSVKSGLSISTCRAQLLPEIVLFSTRTSVICRLASDSGTFDSSCLADSGRIDQKTRPIQPNALPPPDFLDPNDGTRSGLAQSWCLDHRSLPGTQYFRRQRR